MLFDAGPININPNVVYWLIDDDSVLGDVTAGTANLDVTFDIGGTTIRPYLGAGVGIFYIDTDLGGDETEVLGNLIGGVGFHLDFLKPYAQIKYSRSLEGDGDDGDELALTVGLRF